MTASPDPARPSSVSLQQRAVHRGVARAAPRSQEKTAATKQSTAAMSEGQVQAVRRTGPEISGGKKLRPVR